MLIFNKYFNSYHFLFNNLLLYKFFSKFIYSKFLIVNKIYRYRRKHLLIVDNYFEFILVKLKKKYKKLGFSSKLKKAFFFKADFFIYRHSKLKIYNFNSSIFKSYIKKNIYLNLKLLKNSLNKIQSLFIFRSIRGGFIGFTNKITGFLPLKFFILNKKKIIFYKKYFIFNANIFLSFFTTNYPMSFFFSSGFIRNFNKIKKVLRRFFFKRFKFIFSLKNFFFKKYLRYFLNKFFLFKIYKSNFIFFSIFLKLLSLLKSK